MSSTTLLILIGVAVLLAALVALGLFLSKGPPATYDLVIGGGSCRITAPGHLLTHTEDDGNVLLYPPGPECITLRFTVLSGTPPEPMDNPMLEFVRGMAKERGGEFSVQGRKGIATYQERAEERGSKLLMSFWEVGEGKAMTTISATVLEREKDDPRVAEVLAAVPEIIDRLEVLI